MIAVSIFVALCLAVVLPVLAAILVGFFVFLAGVSADIRAARKDREQARRKRAVEDATGRDVE